MTRAGHPIKLRLVLKSFRRVARRIAHRPAPALRKGASALRRMPPSLGNLFASLSIKRSRVDDDKTRAQARLFHQTRNGRIRAFQMKELQNEGSISLRWANREPRARCLSDGRGTLARRILARDRSWVDPPPIPGEWPSWSRNRASAKRGSAQPEFGTTEDHSDFSESSVNRGAGPRPRLTASRR